MIRSVFPMFVGSGRSGTTLLRNIFDCHPDLAMTHEAHFVAPMARNRTAYETGTGFDRESFVADLYRNANFTRQGLERADVAARLDTDGVASFVDAVRSVFGLYADDHGKELYGDKTPGYVNHIEMLAALFPEARFVHIIRDGRDVALGYLDRDEWGPATVAEAALYWRSRVSRGRSGGRQLGADRYAEVRYEDLVDDPGDITRRVCDFLGLDYYPEMLRFHERGADFIAAANTPEAFTGLAQPITKGMRDWRIEMPASDVAMFEAIAGDLLAELGYETSSAAPSLSLRARAYWANLAWQAKRLEARVQPVIKRARRTLQGVRS